MKKFIVLLVVFGTGLLSWTVSRADMEQIMTILTSNLDEEFGHSVANAGDVNGDGYDDLLVGTNSGSVSPSYVYLFFGGPTADTIPDVTLSSEAGVFGEVLSGAGDVNGDGYSDVMIYSRGGGEVVYVYFGGNPMDSVVDVTITGEKWFGQTMTYAGDLNADGYDDAVVGAYWAPGGGLVYIFFGGNPMDSIPDLILKRGTGYGFGIGLRGVGDVNGDGYVDLGVGNPKYDYQRGEVLIYFGGPEFDGSPDGYLRGPYTYSHFGFDLTGCDLNNDGYSDIVVGAPNPVGEIYIYSGGPRVEQTPDLVIHGRLGEDELGRRVLSVGDLNNDGYNDVVSQTHQRVGRLYACYGGKRMDRDFDLVIWGNKRGEPFFGLTFAGIDFNSDGNQDLAVGSRRENCVFIFWIRHNQFTISLTPDTRTVVMGEELGFTATITNNTKEGQNLYFYVDLLNPSGLPLLVNVPVLGPKLKKIPAKKTVTKHISVAIPDDAPLGQYTCTVKADTTEPQWPYFDFIENDSFEFQLISG